MGGHSVIAYMYGSLLVSVERGTLCDPEWHVYNLLTITSEYAPHIQDSFVKLPLKDSNDERDTLGDLKLSLQVYDLFSSGCGQPH